MRNKRWPWIAVGIIAALVVGGAAAWAHEGHEEEEAAAENTGAMQTLTGEVVDVVCYLSHPAQGLGAGHADCAKKCIKSGLPVAIKVGNELYLAAMGDHTAANAQLADWAGKQVKVQGQVLERDGQHLITISKVEPVQ